MSDDIESKAWIQTASGRKFFPFHPDPDSIVIEDIAHALARIARYTGHTSGDFALSVAQHSVMVSDICDPADALAGLLHDGSEAYINDCSRPVKMLPAMAPYREAEARLQTAIYAKFGLPPEMPESVKWADEVLLATESRDLMSPRHPEWEVWIKGVETLPGTIKAWPPTKAEAAFLARFRELIAKRSVA